ncbi:MAG: sigma-70 family RNA polymerase sigma factor [Clostridia bacterium]|nr:sigma-70 family RNA polymerase sigma factor [Clostridia bacterium]
MTMDQRKSESLLRAASGGDDRAFEALCEAYAPLLYASVRRYTGAARESELLQEARLALYRAVRSYSPQIPQVTFGLYAQICIRRALASRFSRPDRVPTCSLEELREDGRWVETDADDLDQQLIRAEVLETLSRFADSELSPMERSVFRLRGQGCKNEEIARRLGVSVKSIENAMSRIKAKFRRSFPALSGI